MPRRRHCHLQLPVSQTGLLSLTCQFGLQWRTTRPRLQLKLCRLNSTKAQHWYGCFCNIPCSFSTSIEQEAYKPIMWQIRLSTVIEPSAPCHLNLQLPQRGCQSSISPPQCQIGLRQCVHVTNLCNRHPDTDKSAELIFHMMRCTSNILIMSAHALKIRLGLLRP